MPKGTDDPKGSDKTFTEEQVNAIVEERLARERKKFEDYDDLKDQVAELVAEKKKLEDEDKSDSEKVSEQLSTLQKQLEEEKEARQKSDAEALRLRVAQAKGLTEKQAARLQGANREELEADADDLLETFGGKDDQKPEKGGPGRPKEKLQAGASNEDDDTEVTAEEADKIADGILAKKKF